MPGLLFERDERNRIAHNIYNEGSFHSAVFEKLFGNEYKVHIKLSGDLEEQVRVRPNAGSEMVVYLKGQSKWGPTNPLALLVQPTRVSQKTLWLSGASRSASATYNYSVI